MKKLLLYFIFNFLATINIPNSAEGQNFEYALSQSEYQSGKIRTMAFFNDKAIFGGSTGECEYPVIWLFDTLGNLLQHQILDIGFYELGWVHSIRYDTLSHQIEILAYTQLGTDFGGSSAYAWKLDTNLNILTTKDLLNPDGFLNNAAQFAGDFILASKEDSFFVYDRDFAVINQKQFEFSEFGIKNGILADSFFVILEQNYTSGESVIYLIDWDGNILQHLVSSEIRQIFNLGSEFFTLDNDYILRKYETRELNPIDSLPLPWADQAQLQKITDNLFSLTLYGENKAIIQIYDSDLLLVHEIKTDLNFETELVTHLQGNTIYQGGKFFGYRPQQLSSFANYRSIIPFVRKMRLSDPYFRREAIEITHVSIKNMVVPLRTESNTLGELFDDFYFMGPGQPLIFELTIKNTSDIIVNNFVYYTDVGLSMFCFSDNNYHYVSDIELQPGEEMTLRDTMFPALVFRDRGLLFYVAAANHLLSDSSFTYLSVTDITTATDERRFINEQSIYPNPAGERIFIRWVQPGQNLYYEVINLQGQVLHSDQVNNSTISLANVSSGHYLLRLFNSSGSSIHKIIKFDQ